MNWRITSASLLLIALSFFLESVQGLAGTKARRTLPELKTHGDIVCYISPSRYITRFVSGHKNELDAQRSSLSESVRDSLKIFEVATSDALAEFCENKEDLEGDISHICPFSVSGKKSDAM